MSIATESISKQQISYLRHVENDVRQTAKDHGIKVRRNYKSGIDVTFQDGEKKHFHGWQILQKELINAFELAE